MAYRIAQHCSTCHFCFNECPAHAIRFVGDEYAIDEAKCIGCGKCAEVCPSGIIVNMDARETPVRHDPLTINADLAVCGGGGAGLVAAVRFAQNTGKRVVLLEKGKNCGGNTTLSHGFIKSAQYSRLHRKAGTPDLREKFVEDLMAAHPGALDETLLRDAQYALCDMAEMLFDLGGYEDKFELVKMTGGPEKGKMFIDFPKRWKYNLKSTDHSMGPGWQSTFAVKKLEAEAERRGVQILKQHRAVKLLTDKSGAICGIVADDPGGQTVVSTPACIIATGGFSHNEEYMRRVRPTFFEEKPVHSFTVAHNTGDGITMVAEVGGVMDWDAVRIPMFGPTHHPFHYGIVRLVEEPQVVRVDKNGRRFQNEAGRYMSFMSPMEELPGHYGWAVMDANTSAVMGTKLIDSGQYDPEVMKGYATWREQLEEEAESFDLASQKADTLEELAEKMGADPAVFTEQIARYNELCAKGEDVDFGKPAQFLMPIEKGPFYASYIGRFNETTMGGIVNDTKLRAVRADGSPIQGLYVAGDCCKGLITDDYMSKFGDCAWAMASGYLCAEHAAEYTDSSNGRPRGSARSDGARRAERI